MVSIALDAHKLLSDEGISARIIDMQTIKPIDADTIIKAACETGTIVTAEDHNIIGGLGSAVAEVIAESGKAVKFKRIAIPDMYSHYVGSQKFLREKFGLSNIDLAF